MNRRDDLAPYLFHQGTNFEAYKYLGCNEEKRNDGYIYSFRVWAPYADDVSLVGDFCGWENPIPMEKVTEKGVWECIYKSDVSLHLKAYKYKLLSGEKSFYKADPYAKYSKGGADGASVIYRSEYAWGDSVWLKNRKRICTDKENYLPIPINIYEVHLGSFLRHSEDNSYCSYTEICDVLIPYLKYMGYTHVEFLPLTEYPYDGSWGYQVCGFFAPTSRFGQPDELKHLVDRLHRAGIGVIMDWVVAHFPKDAWGLYEFDGRPLYEYQGRDRRESPSWGTCFFDLGREEVQSFLISSAMYFLKEYHFDGLRVDAVSSILYLDYDKKPGEWIPNKDGGRDNPEAIAFLKKLNSAVFGAISDVLMIAEESGSYSGVTHPVSSGGLGFNLKWNMGFANDMYDYVSTDPLYRKNKHKALNFPIMYAFSENYILPVSHDEVVHGKKSLIDKFFGSYDEKFKGMRSFLLLFMTYPGKKLMFMGCEYAQFREWDYKNSLEWFMLDYPAHYDMREYTAALNRFYLSHSELWEIDFLSSGFEWIRADEKDMNLVAYKRIDSKGNYLTVVINFSGTKQKISIEGENLCVFSSFGDAEIRFYNGVTEVTLDALQGVILKEKKDNIEIFIGGENNLL